MKQNNQGPRPRRETVVPDNTLYCAMAAIDSVIDEAHCIVGPDELKQLVRAHDLLNRAFGNTGDYRLVDGVAIDLAGNVAKRPVMPSEIAPFLIERAGYSHLLQPAEPQQMKGSRDARRS